MSDYKPDIHKELYEVSKAGDSARVRELLEAGADPDKYKGYTGWTALHWAAYNGHNEVVKTLIQAKCDINVKDNEGNTALHLPALYGHKDVVISLLESGADPRIRNNDGRTPIEEAELYGHSEIAGAFVIRNIEVIEILKKEYNYKLYYNSIIHIGISQGQYEVVWKFLEKVSSSKKKVAMLMTKDPSKISNLLNFLTKMFEKIEDKDKKGESDKIREVFGEMFGMLDRDNIFYLVKSQEFDGKSLLSYIKSQNVRLFRQREELIDLSVKIANLKYEGDSEKAMDEVINNYKSGLASGVGLRDMINMIKERYPWSTSKMCIMISVSLVACLLGIALFAFDLTTDIQFSLEMLERKESISLEYQTYDSVFKNCSLSFPEKCKVKRQALEDCMDEYPHDSRDRENRKEFIDDMKTTGWFAVWHCVQPFLITFIVFLSMNYKTPSSVIVQSWEKLDKVFFIIFFIGCCCFPFTLVYLLYKLVSKLLRADTYTKAYKMAKKLAFKLAYLATLLPMPVFTQVYMLCLNVRGHIARRKAQFQKEMEIIEREIEDYEALGKP